MILCTKVLLAFNSRLDRTSINKRVIKSNTNRSVNVQSLKMEVKECCEQRNTSECTFDKTMVQTQIHKTEQFVQEQGCAQQRKRQAVSVCIAIMLAFCYATLHYVI